MRVCCWPRPHLEPRVTRCHLIRRCMALHCITLQPLGFGQWGAGAIQPFRNASAGQASHQLHATAAQATRPSDWRRLGPLRCHARDQRSGTAPNSPHSGASRLWLGCERIDLRNGPEYAPSHHLASSCINMQHPVRTACGMTRRAACTERQRHARQQQHEGSTAPQATARPSRTPRLSCAKKNTPHRPPTTRSGTDSGCRFPRPF